MELKGVEGLECIVSMNGVQLEQCQNLNTWAVDK